MNLSHTPTSNEVQIRHKFSQEWFTVQKIGSSL